MNKIGNSVLAKITYYFLLLDTDGPKIIVKKNLRGI